MCSVATPVAPSLISNSQQSDEDIVRYVHNFTCCKQSYVELFSSIEMLLHGLIRGEGRVRILAGTFTR